ncbi:MAG: BrnA antitoxin family protein [Thiolinea sp.]
MKQQTDLVKYEFDPANPPALTEKQQVELAALVALPDEAIDYSDISASSEQDWHGAQIGRFYRPIKKQVTVRIDADVLAWLQATGAGYQTRLNKILRDAMAQAK